MKMIMIHKILLSFPILYMESAETFQGIFNDPKKYKVIMEALALALYEEFNS